MENKTEKLTQFFEQVKTLTFWKRLFGWSQFSKLSYEAYQEFKSIAFLINQQLEKISGIEREISILKNDNSHFQEENKKYEIDSSLLKEKSRQFEKENSELGKANAIFIRTEDDRKVEYEKKVESLNSIREKIENDRKKEIDEQHEKEINRLNGLKQAWAEHQNKVREAIKTICQKHTIEYVDNVPFRGTPDNTIKIYDEFVIFDAKSPANPDDLNNFPGYIKLQTEHVKKYIKEENVKKDIFLVIPSNTADVISQFSFNMADYTVYVIMLDALEPIILSLKKIEDYEFADKLSPDDRDSICRVIGRFAHMTKRRIQIDNFFGLQSLDILSKCDTDLPRDVLEKAVDYERSDKLNPPQEKRAKLISNSELEVDSRKIKKEAEAKEIIFHSSIQQNIRNLPLYNNDELNSSLQNKKTKKKNK